MIKAGIYGASGRVGRLLIDDIAGTEGIEVSVIHIRKELSFPLADGITVTNDATSFLENCDIVIDFSLPEAAQTLFEAALKNPKPIVSGTTGFDMHQLNLLKTVSEQMPVLHATNMSVGVAMLSKLVNEAAKKLAGFDIEVVEMHHRHKKDAPSGTALTLAESAAAGRGLDLDRVRVSGRNGNIGERSEDEIAVMALRGGDIVGRHTVGFYNDGEFIELNHTATSRNTFSKGAIRAAQWLVSKENGLYSIADCLEL
jgi:4-hydroxy-tetrahydrodipicolinate reductase